MMKNLPRLLKLLAFLNLKRLIVPDNLQKEFTELIRPHMVDSTILDHPDQRYIRIIFEADPPTLCVTNADDGRTEEVVLFEEFVNLAATCLEDRAKTKGLIE